MSEQMMTVGRLRDALKDLPDEAMLAVTQGSPDGWDRGITTVHVPTGGLIPWSHDCADAGPNHRPGQDCPTVHGAELWIESSAVLTPATPAAEDGA